MVPADLIFGFDFYSFWAAGRVFISGENPYNTELLQAAQISAGWPQGTEMHIFPYPPWSLLFFIPVALLPIEIAKITWAFLSVACMLHGAILINRYIAEEFNLRSLPFVTILTSLILFPPTLREILLGQTAHISFYAIALSLHFRMRPILAGLFLSFTLIKPQQFLPLYCLLFARDLVNLKFQRLIGFLLGAFMQFGLISIFRLDLLFEYISFLDTHRSKLLEYGVVTISRLIEIKLGWSHFREVLLLIMASIFGLIGAFKRIDIRALYVVGLPAALLVSPYHWLHDCLVLYPSFILGYHFMGVRVLYFVIWVFSLQANLGIYPELVTPIITILLLGVSVFFIRRQETFALGKHI
jgi:hypothetical protein